MNDNLLIIIIFMVISELIFIIGCIVNIIINFEYIKNYCMNILYKKYTPINNV